MNEVREPDWKEVQGQSGYLVNADGQVWSDRAKRVIVGTSAGQMKYRCIQFPDGSRQYVHRLVCSAFHGPCPSPEYQVRHLNGDRADNRAVNLAWGTREENNADKYLHGTTPKGEANPQAKLTQSIVGKMRAHREQTNNSYARIGEHFGVSAMTAFRAIKGESWK